MQNIDAKRTQMAANTLAKVRQEAGLSLRELARRAATSHSTLLAYEKGTKSPSIVTFLKIIEACNRSVDFDLSPRIRQMDGIDRGIELEEALNLAAQFPARVSKKMNFPHFGKLN